MTTRERLKLMDEIKRKNDEAWAEHARHRRAYVHAGQPRLSPFMEWLLKALITFFSTLLMGIVALIA